MRILAITALGPKGACQLETLEVATYLASASSTEVVLQGIIVDPSPTEGKLSIYVYGAVGKAVGISKQGTAGLDLAVRNGRGFSVVELPYAARHSPTASSQFSIRLELARESPDSSDYDASLYLGASDVSDALTREHVWDRLVTISSLSFWLFYPKELELVLSQPEAEPGIPSTARRLQRLLSGAVSMEDFELLRWRGRQVSLLKPFVVRSHFADADSEAPDQQIRVALDSVHRRIDELGRSFQALENHWQSELAAQRAERRFMIRLLWSIVGMLVVILLLLLIFGLG